MPVVGRQKILTKPSVQRLHLGAGVAAQRQHHAEPAHHAGVDVGLAAADGGDLRRGEHVGRHRAQVERGDRVAEGVPHRDPALHGGHAGQRDHAGAVAGGVDAAGGGARHPVDHDVPGRRQLAPRPPPGRCRRCSGWRRPPSGSASRPPRGRRRAGRPPRRPRRSAAIARAPLRTVMPLSSKTCWITRAASSSWPGSTWWREETSVTCTPSALVGAGELGAGDARADDDQVLGHLGRGRRSGSR